MGILEDTFGSDAPRKCSVCGSSGSERHAYGCPETPQNVRAQTIDKDRRTKRDRIERLRRRVELLQDDAMRGVLLGILDLLADEL